MKYIKKDEYKNIKHNLRDSSGRLFIIEEDEIDNDEIYELNKFMFDVKEEIKEEIVEEVIIDINKTIIDEDVKEEQEFVEDDETKIDLFEIKEEIVIDKPKSGRKKKN